MNILFGIWSFFATYILQKAPYMVGFLTLLGYCRRTDIQLPSHPCRSEGQIQPDRSRYRPLLRPERCYRRR